MTRRVVTVGSMNVTINADDPTAPELCNWAVLRTRALDELTEAPPRVPIAIVGDVPACVPRVAGDGICGFVARPRDVAHALLRPDAWHARIEGPGYLAHDLTPAIERARRSVNPGVVPPAAAVQLDAPVAADAEQFTPGRGVLVARDAANLHDEFGTVRLVAPPPPPGNVPLTASLREPHATLRPVCGIPLLLPERPLHRAAAPRIRGRVQRRLPGPGGTLVPATGASIGIRGVWHTYPATVSTAPVPIGFCAVTPPLYFDHDIGVTVEGATGTPVGAAITALEPVERGARALTLAPNAGLAPAGGDILRIEDPSSLEAEILVTDGFAAVADPAAPVRVRLRTRVAHLHRRGAVIRRITPGAFVAVGTITREAQTGDRVVFASNLAALLLTTATIVVGRGTPHESWHTATQPPTTPNDATFQHSVPIQADGRFEWPPLARIAQVRVRALHAGHVPLQVDYALDYDGENVLSMIFIN